MGNNENMIDLAYMYGLYMTEANNANTKTNEKRAPKQITNKDDIKEILAINHNKASEKSTVMDLFADFDNGPRFQPYWTIEIPAGAYGGWSKVDKECQSSKKTNRSKFITTVGLWIFNKSFIEPMSDVLGYINEPITEGKYSEINQQVSYALLENKITVRQLKDFIIQSQILMSCCSALAPSHTELIFDMETDIAKKKAELEKQYKDAIETADLPKIKEMENELINYAKDILKDDPAVDMFNSGARSSWGNNVKNMYLLRGALRGTDGNYHVVTSSYIEGLDPKDTVAVNDAAVGGPYSRSRLTAQGGYLEKQFTNLTQHIKILPAGSDCGSTKYITVELTKKNIKDWMFSFMIQGDRLIELLPENVDKYIGKTVNLRYSMFCKSKDGICEKCAGTLFNRMGITNAGLTSMQMASAQKLANMKRFHDSSLNLAEVNVKELFK